ncbi:hypothetical protein M0R01_04860 [bacterium]|nr:hypothetical protein [bacterium]
MEGCVTFVFLLLCGLVLFTIFLPDDIPPDTTWEEGQEIIKENGGWGWAAFCILGGMFAIFSLGTARDKVQKLPAKHQDAGMGCGLVLTIIVVLSYCIIALSKW